MLFVLKRNKLPSKEHTWRNLKGKIREIVKRSVVSRAWGMGRRRNKQKTGFFRAQEVFLCDTLRWIRVTVHLSKTTQCITPRVNSKCQLWTLGARMRQCSFTDLYCTTAVADTGSGGGYARQDPVGCTRTL